MNKVITWAMFCIAIGVLSACEKDILSDEEIKDADSSLNIVTRSGETDGQITYPIAIYIFDSAKKYVTQQVITNADDELSIGLTHGSYTVYAIAGASSDNYELPSENITTTSLISLKTGKTHADLMTTKSDVILTEGGGKYTHT